MAGGDQRPGRHLPLRPQPEGDAEFAGATFAPDGDALFVNFQGQPALTFAITGPWQGRGRH